MDEAARRAQIMKERQRLEETRAAAPSLSDGDAQKHYDAHEENQNGLTQEQMIAAAMLGKFVNNDLLTIRKSDAGGTKVSPVDMSKVMPSGILKARGEHVPPEKILSPVSATADAPVIETPTPLNATIPVPPTTTTTIPPTPPVQPDGGQFEFDFNRQAKYEDIMQLVEKVESRVIMIEKMLKEYIDSQNKKKPRRIITKTNTHGA